MAFRGFHAAHVQFEYAVGHGIYGCKRMPEFVSEHVHVVTRSVPVCQNERLSVIVEFGAIAAAPFTVARFHVECVAFAHKTHKLSYFAVHVVIHVLCGFEHFFFVQSGARFVF